MRQRRTWHREEELAVLGGSWPPCSAWPRAYLCSHPPLLELLQVWQVVCQTQLT